jgi:hypothetical protein
MIDLFKQRHNKPSFELKKFEQDLQQKDVPTRSDLLVKAEEILSPLHINKTIERLIKLNQSPSVSKVDLGAMCSDSDDQIRRRSVQLSQ